MTSLHPQLEGWRLTTAEILYRMPDHPRLLQTYVWQELDLVPDFPSLSKFLSFWERNLEGRLVQVRVAATGLVKPASFRFAEGLLHLN